MSHDPRAELVKALSMLVHEGIADFNGHASIRSGEGRFLINSGASVRSRLSVEDVVEVNYEGLTLARGAAAPPIEYPIHAEIYRRRPDVGSIIHCHPLWSTLLSMTGHAYAPVYAQGVLLGTPPQFPDAMSVDSGTRGAALAATLGDAAAVLLRSHGIVVVADDMITCFALTIYAEQNAERQVRAMQIGLPNVLDAQDVRTCERNLRKPALFRKTWDFYAGRLSSRARPLVRKKSGR